MHPHVIPSAQPHTWLGDTICCTSGSCNFARLVLLLLTRSRGVVQKLPPLLLKLASLDRGCEGRKERTATGAVVR